MKTGVLAICDLDEAYAKNLMEYISDKEGMPFKTIAFTNKEALLDYTQSQHIDILLISNSAMDESIEECNIEKIILLSPGDIFSEYIGYSSIYKFQSTENIIREVLDYYADIYKNEGCINIDLGDAEIIGVYSPVGRVGKTTFALTLGQILAADYAVLYINLEEFSAIETFFEKTYSADLSDLMYYYMQNSESLHIRLKSIVENYHGMGYIPPLNFSDDLRKIETEEWIKLIEKINSFGIYDKIILDFSNMIEDPFSMLSYCQKIYMPLSNNYMSVMKVQAFEKYLLDNEKEELLNKIIKLNMPSTKVDGYGTAYLEKHLWGALGDLIRRMIRGGDVA